MYPSNPPRHVESPISPPPYREGCRFSTGERLADLRPGSTGLLQTAETRPTRRVHAGPGTSTYVVMLRLRTVAGPPEQPVRALASGKGPVQAPLNIRRPGYLAMLRILGTEHSPIAFAAVAQDDARPVIPRTPSRADATAIRRRRLRKVRERYGAATWNVPVAVCVTAARARYARGSVVNLDRRSAR